jgi:hypothetical protein
MQPATDPRAFKYRQTGWPEPSNNRKKTNMSAKALAGCSFEPALEQTVPTDRQPSKGLASEIQFREDLWREYRLEALNAGFSTSQAIEYASALSLEMGLVAGVSAMAPLGRCWFYQTRVRVVNRTITSGLIGLTRWKKNKNIGRKAALGTPIFAPTFRPWNAGGKS